MESFKYKAMNMSGEISVGKVEANSKELAFLMVKDLNLFPIEIKEETMLSKDISFGRAINSKDLTIFCTQMETVLRAGISVLEALKLLEEQVEKKTFRFIIHDLYKKVEQGESLSSAMEKHSDNFPNILVNMIKAGEISGNLELSFKRMAVHFDKEYKLQQEVSKASIYPIVVGVIALAVVIILLVVVVPTFVTMFNDLGATLPITTRLLIAISDVIINKWFIILAVLVLLSVVSYYVIRVESVRDKLSYLILKAPIIGKLKVKIIASRFSRTMSTLLASGLSILDALDIVAKIVGNYYVQKGIEESAEKVSKGVPLSKPINDMGIFPPMIVQMLKIGEDTGELETILDNVADFYDSEVETGVKQLTTLIEPIIIVFLASVVGFIVLSVVQPMFEMYSLLGSM